MFFLIEINNDKNHKRLKVYKKSFIHKKNFFLK